MTPVTDSVRHFNGAGCYGGRYRRALPPVMAMGAMFTIEATISYTSLQLPALKLSVLPPAMFSLGMCIFP